MKLKTLVTFIMSTLFCLALPLHADENIAYNEALPNIETDYATYVRMSTEELQIAMETLSLNGEYPLEMGVELMKRWATES